MKIKNTLILGSLLFISMTVFSQDKKAAPPAKKVAAPDKPIAPVEAKGEEVAAQPGQPSEGDKKWMEYMTPGPMHKMLAACNGDWHEELTFWMTPGGPPTKAESKCFNSMILDGRYQQSVHTGMMMGMPFEGHSTVGYDNALKTFQSTWVDNMGSGIMFLQGKYDEKTKSITFRGKAVDAASGKEESVREVMKFVDDNTQMMEMYMTKAGKEFKNMEIKFTRK